MWPIATPAAFGAASSAKAAPDWHERRRRTDTRLVLDTGTVYGNR
jgi:hypothetical protein